MSNSNPENLYVRMRPYDKQAGNLVRRYDWRIPGSNKFLTFTKAGIWHKVPFRYGEILKSARQDDTNKLSPPVFDVCTEEEARMLDRRAKEEREAKRRLTEPTVDTAVDMTEAKPKPVLSSRENALKSFDKEVSGVEEDEDEGESQEPPIADFNKKEPVKTPVKTSENKPDISWTKKELRAEAVRRGIPVTRSDNKTTLLQLLNK